MHHDDVRNGDVTAVVAADDGDDERSGVLRAVVADEWCLVREGIRSLAESLGVVCGVLASTATEALVELRPGDLFVLGSCPDTSAEIAVRRARMVEGVHIVVLAAKIDRTTVMQLCTAGADAVLERSARAIDLDIALDTISKGHRYLAPTVLDVVFASAPSGEPTARKARLSAREVAVLELLATGRSNREIAIALHIGAETVKTHLSNLYLKLAVTSRDQAVAAALRYGLV